MDDMEREALRRAEQMRSAFPGNANLHKSTEDIPVEVPADNAHNEKKSFDTPKEVKGDNQSQYPQRTTNNSSQRGNNTPSQKGKSYGSQTKFPPFAKPLHSQRQGKAPQREEGKKDIFDFLLKDKDTTLILLLIFFLYEDNSDPMLLMALVYLLV